MRPWRPPRWQHRSDAITTPPRQSRRAAAAAAAATAAVTGARRRRLARRRNHVDLHGVHHIQQLVRALAVTRGRRKPPSRRHRPRRRATAPRRHRDGPLLSAAGEPQHALRGEPCGVGRHAAGVAVARLRPDGRHGAVGGGRRRRLRALRRRRRGTRPPTGSTAGAAAASAGDGRGRRLEPSSLPAVPSARHRWLGLCLRTRLGRRAAATTASGRGSGRSRCRRRGRWQRSRIRYGRQRVGGAVHTHHPLAEADEKVDVGARQELHGGDGVVEGERPQRRQRGPVPQQDSVVQGPRHETHGVGQQELRGLRVTQLVGRRAGERSRHDSHLACVAVRRRQRRLLGLRRIRGGAVGLGQLP